MREKIYRYTVTTRLSHWFWVIAFAALVSSGLQIFNAAPYLDASDKSDPAGRVLSIDSSDGIGATTVLGHTVMTTGWLGCTDDRNGARAFPSWITIPSFPDLADGRWHLFFAWFAILCWLAWITSSAIKGNLREFILRPSDIPKLWPMQAYYLHLRKEPPPHGTYNPLQKITKLVSRNFLQSEFGVPRNLFSLEFACPLPLSSWICSPTRA